MIQPTAHTVHTCTFQCSFPSTFDTWQIIDRKLLLMSKVPKEFFNMIVSIASTTFYNTGSGTTVNMYF